MAAGQTRHAIVFGVALVLRQFMGYQGYWGDVSRKHAAPANGLFGEGGVTFSLELSELIGMIYDAGMEPQRWPAVLDRIRECFDSCKAALTAEDLSPEAGFAFYYTDSSVDPAAVREYGREFGSSQDRNPQALFHAQFPLARPIRRTALISDDAFTSTQAYEQWNEPMGIFYLAVTKLMATPRGAVLLQIARDRAGGDFGNDELELITILVPHLRRAVQMQARLAVADAGRMTLDGLPWGILVVDGAGRILSANTAAEDLFAVGDGFTTRRGYVAGAGAAQTAALRAAVRQALASAGGDALPPQAVQLPRPSGLRPFQVLVTPLRQPERPGQPPVAALFVSDPERRHQPQRQVLQRLYGLSRAEAALTQALLDGCGLGEVADGLGIALSTAKTQLQSVFAKTDTRRQTELLSLLLKAPALLGAAPEHPPSPPKTIVE